MNPTQDSFSNPDTARDDRSCSPDCLHESETAAQSIPQTLLPSRTPAQGMLQIPALMAIGAVKLYQYLISPWLGRRCRFYPSCSQYFILSVQKFGLIRGFCKGTARICRCHPWNPGGYDPP